MKCDECPMKIKLGCPGFECANYKPKETPPEFRVVSYNDLPAEYTRRPWPCYLMAGNDICAGLVNSQDASMLAAVLTAYYGGKKITITSYTEAGLEYRTEDFQKDADNENL